MELQTWWLLLQLQPRLPVELQTWWLLQQLRLELLDLQRWKQLACLQRWRQLAALQNSKLPLELVSHQCLPCWRPQRTLEERTELCNKPPTCLAASTAALLE